MNSILNKWIVFCLKFNVNASQWRLILWGLKSIQISHSVNKYVPGTCSISTVSCRDSLYKRVFGGLLPGICSQLLSQRFTAFIYLLSSLLPLPYLFSSLLPIPYMLSFTRFLVKYVPMAYSVNKYIPDTLFLYSLS